MKDLTGQTMDRRHGLSRLVELLMQDDKSISYETAVGRAKGMWTSKTAIAHMHMGRMIEIPVKSIQEIMDKECVEHPEWSIWETVDEAYQIYKKNLQATKGDAPVILSRANFTLVPVTAEQRNAPMPDWFADVFIHWSRRGEAPSVKILTKAGRALVAECDASGFTLHNGREWQAVHPDGTLMTQFVHSGILRKIGHKHYQTSQWQGFGGRVFTIKTTDGDTVELRGPWFGKPSAGWCDIHVVGVDRISKGGTSKPWHAFGGQFGMFMSDAVLIQCLLKSKEQISFARVNGRIEPYLTSDGGPKRFL